MNKYEKYADISSAKPLEDIQWPVYGRTEIGSFLGEQKPATVLRGCGGSVTHIQKYMPPMYINMFHLLRFFYNKQLKFIKD